MKQFLIHSDGDRIAIRTIEANGQCLGRICWDELLYAITLAMRGQPLPTLTVPDDPGPIAETIRVIETDEDCGYGPFGGKFWRIERGDDRVDSLTQSECLAFLALYTHDGRQIYGGFRRPEATA